MDYDSEDIDVNDPKTYRDPPKPMGARVETLGRRRSATVSLRYSLFLCCIYIRHNLMRLELLSLRWHWTCKAENLTFMTLDNISTVPSVATTTKGKNNTPSTASTSQEVYSVTAAAATTTTRFLYCKINRDDDSNNNEGHNRRGRRK